MPSPLLEEWKDQGNVRAIAQIELLPILLAKQLWRNRTRHRRVLMFVDNEVAKFACVSMCSFSKHSRNILRALVDEELSNQSWTWYSRVASYSNPSDAASRLDFDIMEKRFLVLMFVRVALPVSMMKSS